MLPTRSVFIVLTIMLLGIGRVAAASDVPTKLQGQNEPAPLYVAIELALSTVSNPPSFYGTTNLPDGTAFSAYIHGDLPRCYPSCYVGSNLLGPPTVIVRNGHFAIGPELTDGRSLNTSWAYTIELMTDYDVQPQDAKRLFAYHFSNLRGPLIFVPVPKGGRTQAVFPRPADQSEEERVMGLEIHYITHLMFGINGRPIITR